MAAQTLQEFDAFAPLLADAGWRVVAWDHRGHGDSQHAALYSSHADVRDALSVLDATTPDPVPVIAHSKGGGMMLQLATALPRRMSKIVVIDGLPSPDPHPDVSNHERRQMIERSLLGQQSLGRGPSGESPADLELSNPIVACSVDFGRGLPPGQHHRYSPMVFLGGCRPWDCRRRPSDGIACQIQRDKSKRYRRAVAFGAYGRSSNLGSDDPFPGARLGCR